jgi:hypothetical protein
MQLVRQNPSIRGNGNQALVHYKSFQVIPRTMAADERTRHMTHEKTAE